ncbi:MAG TPA: hypothetical protein VD969_22290 [Symbiobacteriaceae bacterium]|nr:hypothetical protein [Symbiobacteriaceae bacterium]
MNRAVSGTLTVRESGRPLAGLQVVAARLTGGDEVELELLGGAISGDLGRFRVAYEPLDGPSDLLLFVYSPTGRLVYTEPLHRAIAGAELRLHVEIPRRNLICDLH